MELEIYRTAMYLLASVFAFISGIWAISLPVIRETPSRTCEEFQISLGSVMLAFTVVFFLGGAAGYNELTPTSGDWKARAVGAMMIFAFYHAGWQTYSALTRLSKEGAEP